MLLLIAISIIDTYALFETNSSGNKNLSIGKWHILLNGENASQSKTISLHDFVYSNGEHTQDDYFAPGSSLYFDLDIDATETDVSVEYYIVIDDTKLEEHPNINFSIIEMETNEIIEANSYSGIILLDDEIKTKNLRVNLDWVNDSLYDSNDIELINDDLDFEINVNFKQYIGE